MKTLTLLLCVLALPAMAADKSVTIEYIWGFGGTTAHKGFALRVGQDNTEAHIAHWFGPRSNTVVGFGVVARTEGDGQAANRDVHMSGAVGLAYAFRTNSVLSNHLQPYLRLAGGLDLESNGDTEVEFSYSRYGFDVAEQFGGLGLRFNNRDNLSSKSLVTTQNAPVDTPPDDVPPGPPDDVPPGPPDDVPPSPGDVPPGPPGDDEGNNGHGNDEDGCDESNPGNGGPPNCNS